MLSLLQRQLVRRRLSLRRSSTTAGAGPEPDDFRPPWVYTTSRLVSYTLIPGVAFYSIFFYDFGDHEHVFQPVRRWAMRQKAAFFTLSPEEQGLLQASKAPETVEVGKKSVDKEHVV